jgi:hypothetical protein
VGGGRFAYNTAVVNVNSSAVRNVYIDKTVINNTTIVNNYTSFNGPGGINARPTPEERTATPEQHFQPTSGQVSHQQMASRDRNQWAPENHGRPGTPAMGSVNERRNNQQERIGNGVRSGQLTPHETSNLEHKEANINHETAADRHANGGALTPQEHQKINHQQNQASRDIYQDKHNDKTDHH